MTDDERNTAQAHEPRTVTELTVSAIWSEVLQIGDMPASTDDFFALGGNSMSMVIAEFRIMEELPVQLPAGALLSAPTIRELARLIDAQLSSSDSDSGARSARAGRDSTCDA
jgi:acyl carrier protein